MTEQPAVATVGAAFAERSVDADGSRIRYMEAGTGEPLVHLQGAQGGVGLSPALDLLSQHFHVYVFEQPVSENAGNSSNQLLAARIGRAAASLGLGRYNLLGTSSGARTALWLAIQTPELVSGLVLESPAALEADAEPDGDRELKAGMRGLSVPCLVLCGTRDSVRSPTVGRAYRELIPNSHFVLVYAAGHAIGLDRPAAFSGVVVDFLRRHQAFVVKQESALLHP